MDVFATAVREHQTGRFKEAENLYRRVLQGAPRHAEALHLLGVLHHQTRRSELGLKLIRKAIQMEPRTARYHSNLGFVLNGMGRHGEAEACCREALRLDSNLADAYGNLGCALNLLGRYQDAEACFRRAIALKPNYPEAYNNLGNVLQRQRQFAEAEDCYRTALRLRPGFADGHVNLGNFLQAQGVLDEAEACHREAIRLKPDFAEAYSNLGGLLHWQGQFAEAETHCRKAVHLNPSLANAQVNLGNLLEAQGRFAEAERCYRAALRLQPALALAHCNLGLALLGDGRYEEGWKAYEWRWQAPETIGIEPRGFAQPQWQGEGLGDKTLLLHAEQGFGDTLQFCRYVPLAAARGGVVLEAPDPLFELLSGLAGTATIVRRGEPLPPFDVHCPLMSLPRLFGTTLDTVPADVPYLSADALRAAAWRDRVGSLSGLRIGLVWAGNSGLGVPAVATKDRRRSIALAQLAPLAEVGGISFVSLQKGEAAKQTASAPTGMIVHDWTEQIADFADTAALVETLDLVISVDTAVVHLAGALGKPVWLLNRFDTDWRWLRDRSDSPWYPSLRIFRQPVSGDWDSVVHDVRGVLEDMTASR